MKVDNIPYFSPEQYKGILEEAFVNCYHTNNDHWSCQDAMREVTAYFLKSMGDYKGQYVLDIGAGAGKDAEILLKVGHYVTGIDLYAHEVWESLHITWGDRVQFVKSHFTDWRPFPEKKFDAVLDNGCFHHQHPTVYSTYLTHLKALLKPNGIVMFSVFTPLEENTDGYYINHNQGRIGRCFTSNELQQLLANHGFVWLDSHRIHRPLDENYLPAHYLAALVKNHL